MTMAHKMHLVPSISGKKLHNLVRKIAILFKIKSKKSEACQAWFYVVFTSRPGHLTIIT